MPLCGTPVRVYADPAAALEPPPALCKFKLNAEVSAKLHQGLKAIRLSPYNSSTWQTFVRRALREMVRPRF